MWLTSGTSGPNLWSCDRGEAGLAESGVCVYTRENICLVNLTLSLKHAEALPTRPRPVTMDPR